jgi:hypothetical protein
MREEKVVEFLNAQTARDFVVELDKDLGALRAWCGETKIRLLAMSDKKKEYHDLTLKGFEGKFVIVYDWRDTGGPG